MPLILLAAIVSLVPAPAGMPRIEALPSPNDRALVRAVSDSNLVEIRRLVKRGANVNLRSSDGEPLLSFALSRERAVPLLLALGASANGSDRRGDIPLHKVASGLIGPEARRVRLARLLLDHGAHVDAANHDGTTALQRAASSKYSDLVSLLLERGANPNARDLDGKTPLIYAAETLSGASMADHLSTVGSLLKAGAALGAADRSGLTALDHARLWRDNPMTRLLEIASMPVEGP